MPPINISKLYTVDRYITEQEDLHPEATGEFTSLLRDLMFAIRIISRDVRRAGLNDILGLTESTNVHGEMVRRLDVYANEVIYRAMNHSGHLCAMISEENDELIQIPSKFKRGKYILAYDPLDGSSNIDVNITIGTIFSLYQKIDISNPNEPTLEDILQPGYKQKAAGYVLYGSSTILVYTTGNGVNVFTYDPTIGEFLLTYENLTIPKKGRYYSCNEGNYFKWEEKVRQYVDYIKTPGIDSDKPYTMRYIATAVGDIHRTLHYGGIYMYPAEKNLPNGKLRLLYEVNPLSMIIENAGGKAIDGKNRILDIIPNNIHQTTPVFMGSPENIDELMLFLENKHPYQMKNSRTI